MSCVGAASRSSCVTSCIKSGPEGNFFDVEAAVVFVADSFCAFKSLKPSCAFEFSVLKLKLMPDADDEEEEAADDSPNLNKLRF